MENTIKVARLQTIKEFRSSQQLSPGEGIRRVSCVTLWINDLNSVRGSLGHVTGEQVLALCVERIASEIRDSDEVLDLGGDAFAVLLHDLDRRDVVNTIAERLLYRLQRSLLIEDHVIDVAVTAGIAIGEAPTGDYDLLIKRSSFALHATRSHSDPSFFDAELEHQLRLKQSLSYDLRKALPLRQFFLHYQPQVDIVRGRVSGVEALVRWQHPILGLVSPGDFIPLAEATGFICDLGAWVLRTACKYAFTLDPQITMAVNVSPIQFRSPQFISDVRDALAASGLTGSRLEIEITEGVLLNSSEVTSRAVESLRELGVRIAMDDFGTGYSSLSQLARMQFDTIKIDRSLVGRDPKHRAIVRSVVALSQGLGMEVLAEGIETEEDLRALLEDGCKYFQGYFFGRATPSANLGEVFTQIGRKITELNKRPSEAATLAA